MRYEVEKDVETKKDLHEPPGRRSLGIILFENKRVSDNQVGGGKKR